MKHPDLTSGELEALAELVGRRTGLDYPEAKWPELERALKEAASQGGFDSVGQLAEALLSATATDEQLASIDTFLTVGETYFFRDPKAFAALERHVLPQLVRGRSPQSALRIWSAGCSDGAEPYSIAIACSRTIRHLEAPDAMIVATDIDRDALERAKAGVFTRWSLHGATAAFKRDHFSARSGERFELKPEIRAKVRFIYDNLVEAQRARPFETTHVDIIFCRNVIMYFSPPQAKVAADRLQESLAEGGYLFVAPCEVARAHFPGLELVQIEGTYCFRRPERVAPSGMLVATARATSPGRESASDAPDRLDAALARIKSLADAGRLEEARALCLEISDDARMSARYHFLHATILQELGDVDSAASALRQVLYLRPDFALAHVVLGNLASQQGHGHTATMHFAAVVRLLESLPAESILPDSDGTTAGELRAMANHMQGRR